MNYEYFLKDLNMYEQLKRVKSNKIRAINNLFLSPNNTDIHNLHHFSSRQVSMNSSLIQRDSLTDSIRNICNYSPDLVKTYGLEKIKAVLIKTGIIVRGHASGGSGDSQNAATTSDLARLKLALQEYREEVEEEKTYEPKTFGSSRHSKEEEINFRIQKEKDKKAKKKKRQQEYQKQSKHNFEKKPPKGGGGKMAL